MAFLLQGMSLAVLHEERPALTKERTGSPHTPAAPLAISDVFSVTITADGGPGSLRQAILDANASPGPDEIRFIFAEPVTLTLSAELPEITDAVAITETISGVTIDGADAPGAPLLVLSNAGGSRIQGLRLVNSFGGPGFMVSGDLGGTIIISNTVENSAGGIWLDNTQHFTATHNVLLGMGGPAVMAENSHSLRMLQNRIRDVDGAAIHLSDGISNTFVLSNTLDASGTGIMAAGNPAPVGVVMRGNFYTDTAPISLGPGANNDFPAPRIFQAYLLYPNALVVSVLSPADPISYTYPLSMDVYRVRDGNYIPLGASLLYDAATFPNAFTDTIVLNGGPIITGSESRASVGVLPSDQIALIATTSNPSTSPFSTPVSLLPDQDADGVPDTFDRCPGTVIPEAGVPSVQLGVNRFALVDGDFVFDTVSPEGQGPGRTYTTTDTGGCSCEQIIEALGLGAGHTRLGCSISAMDEWVAGGPAARHAPDLENVRTAAAPETYALDQNYPNPFNPATRIVFQVPEARRVVLRVYDMLGREVVTLVNEERRAGIHQVRWDGLNAQGRPVASGVYLYRIEAGDFAETRTMTLHR